MVLIIACLRTAYKAAPSRSYARTPEQLFCTRQPGGRRVSPEVQNGGSRAQPGLPATTEGDPGPTSSASGAYRACFRACWQIAPASYTSISAKSTIWGTAADYRETHDRRSEGVAERHCGQALQDAGRPDEAAEAFRAAVEIFREVGDGREERHSARTARQRAAGSAAGRGRGRARRCRRAVPKLRGA